MLTNWHRHANQHTTLTIAVMLSQACAEHVTGLLLNTYLTMPLFVVNLIKLHLTALKDTLVEGHVGVGLFIDGFHDGRCVSLGT